MMSEMNLMVCENFEPEFKKILEKRKYSKVNLISFPSLCQNRANAPKVENILNNIKEDNHEEKSSVVICSEYCNVKNMISSEDNFELVQSESCFNHIGNRGFIDYITDHGGYLIGLGWLNKWQENIKAMGFDKKTAGKFFGEFTEELVYFDGCVDPGAKEKLKKLSKFLDIPYRIIPYEVRSIEYLLDSIISKWRLENSKEKSINDLRKLQSESAEYAAIFEILNQLAVSNKKRDAVEKIKAIFVNIMGAETFEFYNYDNHKIANDTVLTKLANNTNENYIINKEENTFYIKIEYNDYVHGVLKVGDFRFSEYIDKYINFTLGIYKIFGLVLTNIKNYEKLLSSQEDLKYKSYHDSLTNLYNRTYFNEVADARRFKDCDNLGIFSFDIDNLKYLNDNHGHLEGDRLIISAAKVLDSSFRESDLVFRIGGDEFIGIIDDCSNELAKSLVKRIKEEINIYNKSIDKEYLKLGISIGYAIRDIKEDIDELMKKADDQMYKDKISKK